ncbi:KR domain-containing protein [Streptomyces sp. FXJ1.4098]|nr:KR domain-containing protein [Streptomyces sp. FXJ1.4098]
MAGIDPAHPLTGIVHAAGARAGAPAQVWHAKATVAAQLAAATQELPLRWFVVFTAPVTDPDEPNAIDHAAAHTYCDALIAHRHARGLPGTAVTWSPGADPAQDGAALLDAVCHTASRTCWPPDQRARCPPRHRTRPPYGRRPQAAGAPPPGRRTSRRTGPAG